MLHQFQIAPSPAFLAQQAPSPSQHSPPLAGSPGVSSALPWPGPGCGTAREDHLVPSEAPAQSEKPGGRRGWGSGEGEGSGALSWPKTQHQP